MKEISILALQECLANILGGEANDYDANGTLDGYGVDSLSRVEIMNYCNEYCSKKMTPAFLANENVNITILYNYILENKAF